MKRIPQGRYSKGTVVVFPLAL